MSSPSENRTLRCPYCLRSHSLENAMLNWCMGRHTEEERKAKGFVEADELVYGGGGAFG